MITDDTKWLPIQEIVPGIHYDFQLKDGTIIMDGMYKNGRFGDRYGIQIARPKYYRKHTT